MALLFWMITKAKKVINNKSVAMLIFYLFIHVFYLFIYLIRHVCNCYIQWHESATASKPITSVPGIK